jgi:ferric-dicitrate binding protein FerR (iron transport regulator)
MKNEKEILKWLNGELTEQEFEDLKKSEGSDTLEKIAHYSSFMQTPPINPEEALNAFKKRTFIKNESIVRRLNIQTLFKVAAAFAVILTTSYFLFFNNTTTFETQIAQTTTFNLPDKSKVKLNAASKISFNEKSWDTNRNLDLDGEAYFEVKKGQRFSVNTADGVVQVLGTHFNVKQRKDYFEVHCYEGLVSVTHQNKTVKLPPGKTFRVVNDNIEAVADFNSTSPSWISQESSFDRIPLSQVIAELERQFVIEIKTKNVDTSKLFTGTFTHKDQKIALEAVTIPLQLSYTIKGKTILFYNYAAE